MADGIGLAKQRQLVGPQQAQPVQQERQDILGSLFRHAGDFSAGVRGGVGPSERIARMQALNEQKKMARQQALRQQTAHNLQVFAAGSKIVDDIMAAAPDDPKAREKYIQTNKDIIHKQLPNFDIDALFDLPRTETGATPELVALAKDSPALQALIAAGKIPEAWAFAVSPELRLRKEDDGDAKFGPLTIDPSGQPQQHNLETGEVEFKGTRREGIAYSIPGVGVRTSFDGGRTYQDNGAQKPMPSGSFKFTVTGGRGDVLPGEPGKAERAGAGKAAREAVGDVVEATSFMRNLDRVGKGAVGVRGFLVGEFGGVLEQMDDVLGTGAGRSLVESIAGDEVTPEEVTAFRAQAKAFVAGSVPEATGENSDRITQRELEIAATMQRADLLRSSFNQIQAAVQLAIVLRFARMERNSIVAGAAPEHDLSTDEGELNQAIELLNLGLTKQNAGTGIEILKEQRELLARTGVPIQ